MKSTSRNSLVALSAAAALAGFSGCSEPKPEKQEAGTTTVATVNYPLAYFAERIGGEEVEVSFPAPTNEDPAYWLPEADTVAAFQDADVILANGAGYAQWLERVSLPMSKVVDTSAGFSDQYISVDGSITHSHGPGGEHAHGGTAFTTWLDMQHATAQAAAVCQAISKLCPAQKAVFQQRFEELKTDLATLEKQFTDSVGDRSQEPIVFSHPVFQYMAHRHHLNGRAVHWEPDEPPSEDQWQELATLLKKHPAEWMIWEGEPMRETADRLKELGVASVVFDPCGNAPETGDYITMMQHNIQNMRSVYGN